MGGKPWPFCVRNVLFLCIVLRVSPHPPRLLPLSVITELEEGNSLCRREAAWVFLNMVECGAEPHKSIIPEMVELGVIAAVCPNLDKEADPGEFSERGVFWFALRRRAWLGLAFAWLGLAWFVCLAWLGLTWLGLAFAWLGLAWLGLAFFASLGLASLLLLAWLSLLCFAVLGLAWLGLAWLGLAWLSLLCFAVLGLA